MEVEKGQAFSIGAVIFSSLILLAAFALNTPEFQQENTVKEYFENILRKQSDIINQQLEENYSEDQVERKIYLFDRFVNTTASRKGLEYAAFQAVIIPEKGKSLFVNYRNSSTSFTFEASDTHSVTVSGMETAEINTSSDQNRFNLTSADLNINETIRADGPTLLGYVRISNSQTNWENYVVR